MNRMAGDRAVQVDNVEQFRALFQPVFRCLHRVIEINRLLVHLSLVETDAAPILEIDGWDDEHRLSLLYESCEVRQDAEPDLLALFRVKLAGEEAIGCNTRNEGSPVVRRRRYQRPIIRR